MKRSDKEEKIYNIIWNKKIILALKGGIIIFYYDKKLYNTRL